MKRKTLTYLVLSLAALVILAGVWLFFFDNPSQEQTENEPIPWANTEALGQLKAQGPSSTDQDTQEEIPLAQTHTNQQHNFSVRHPEGFTVGQFQDGESTNVVIQNSAQGLGIQIYITPLEEPIDITPEQIQNDIPGITVKDPQPLLIGESDNGLAFVSENDSFGESREVWFTYNDTLYQVSTYIELDPLLQAMMNTWEFN